jgi:hypothetical protein
MLFTEPIMFPTAMYGTFVQVVLFFLYVAYPYMLVSEYSFSDYQVGLAFLPLLVGSALALPILKVLDTMIFQRAKLRAEAEGLSITPEERLWCCIIGGIMLPISLFW